jgi:hypothetical protein
MLTEFVEAGPYTGFGAGERLLMSGPITCGRGPNCGTDVMGHKETYAVQQTAPTEALDLARSPASPAGIGSPDQRGR